MAVSWVSQRTGALSPGQDAAAERSRRTVVKLVFVIYFLFLLEGMLRKWVAPQLSDVLYFMRDPFVLIVYWIAFSRGLVRAQGWLLAWLIVAAATTVCGMMVLALNGMGLIAGLLALRSYWFYMPLAFVVASCFEKGDLFRFVRLNLMLAVPISLLVLSQYRSAPGAFINRGIDADAPVATVVEGVVRPYGVFTYTGQHVVYVASLLASLALAWILRRELRLGMPWLALATGAVLVMALTTGSRSIYFFAAQLAAMLGLLVLTGGRERGSAILFLCLFALGAILLFATALQPAFEAILARQTGAEAAEGNILARALGIVTSFTQVLGEVPALGYGIGVGTSTVAAWTGGIAGYVPAENEWERIVQELGPFFGLAVIAARTIFVTTMVARAWRAATRGAPAALILLGFVALVMLAGQITFSSIVGFLAWLYVGLALAMTKPAEPDPEQRGSRAFRSRSSTSAR